MRSEFYCRLKSDILRRAALTSKPSPIQSETSEIENVQVLNYAPIGFPWTGVWIQDRNRHITVYSRNALQEYVSTIDFDNEEENGPLHMHSSIEIGYVVEGRSKQVFYGKEVTFEQGDFWLVDEDCYHCDVYHSEELYTVYVSFSSDTVDSAMLRTIDNSVLQRFLSLAILRKKKRQYIHFTPKNGGEHAAAIMESLLKETLELEVGYENIVKGLLERLLQCLCAEYRFSLDAKERQKERDIVFYEVEKYLTENYRDANIRDLTKRFNYNEDYFNRLIKEYKGCTYNDFIKQLRLDKAAQLLAHKDVPIEKVIEELGYQSRSHFYRVFKERYGVTPSKYRDGID